MTPTQRRLALLALWIPAAAAWCLVALVALLANAEPVALVALALSAAHIVALPLGYALSVARSLWREAADDAGWTEVL
jgi:hypothetical protein